ncbi:hypothetical protein BV898_15755 [Hypsibius exemplaris]|uniref:Uncharacterized protein n=1 Tax=Hypsibius exemplaris TaxID=2072580 RepID=A0A9X6NEL4_HYPEX|nr:hypothetical protein BV898_15755 [Hypsibius exemplaris]
MVRSMMDDDEMLHMPQFMPGDLFGWMNQPLLDVDNEEEEGELVLNDFRSQRGVFSSAFDGYNLSRMFLNRSFESDLSDIFIDGTGNRRVELAVTYFAADKGGSRQVDLNPPLKEKQFAPLSTAGPYHEGSWFRLVGTLNEPLIIMIFETLTVESANTVEVSAFLPFLGEAAKRIYYKTWFLDDYCGVELQLGIANLSQSLGAGTLVFRSYPQQPCSVNVTFDLGSSQFAIYANIKALYLRRGDSLIFFERRGTTARLIKRLRPASDGTIHGYTNPTSVDHFRTSFGQELTLCIQFLEGSVGMMPLQSPLTLDFNFIMETHSNTDLYTYCSALSGYIHQRLFCETGDRINCPAAYNYNVYGLNPAFAKDYDSVDKFGAICGTNNPPDTANEEYIRPRWPNRNSSFARRRFARKYEIDHGRPWVSIAPTTTASPVVVKTGPAYRKNQWEAYTINYWMFTSPVPSFREYQSLVNKRF